MARTMLHLTFSEELIREPLIYRLGKEFRIVTSIYRAAITETDGWVLLEMIGENQEIRRAMDFLRSMGVKVEERLDEGF
ncbi:MAG: NIL domain-containing protein [bacterium]|nr:NIL domain-containing protein [bacterium]